MTIGPNKKSCKEKSEKSKTDIIDISNSGHTHLEQKPSSSWQKDVDNSSENSVQSHKRRHRSPGIPARQNRGKHTALLTSNDVSTNKKTKSQRSVIRRNIPHQVLETTEECDDGNNSEDEYDNSMFDDQELEEWFVSELATKRKFVIKKMKTDGACLFRAVAEQIFGDEEMHNVVRNNCVDHMDKNADFFKQYITEPFHTYLQRKRLCHTHGNHIEIQAISEIYNRPVEVYRYGIEPINTFHTSSASENAPIRLSYHNNVHYNAVIDPNNATVGVGLGLPGHQPGNADKELIKDAIHSSEKTQIEETMLKDKIKETDWELTQEAIEEQAARESYLQWLKDEGSRTRSIDDQFGGPSFLGCQGSATTNTDTDGDCGLTHSASTDDADLRVNNLGGGAGGGQGTAEDEEDEDEDEEDVVGDRLKSDDCLVESKTSETLEDTSLNDSIHPAQVVLPISPAIPPPMLNSNFGGLGDWADDDIMAQVLAASEQEYFDCCRANASKNNSVSGGDDEKGHVYASVNATTSPSTSKEKHRS